MSARRLNKTDPASRKAAAASRKGDKPSLWRKVASSLEREIVSGALAAGSRLASETMLSRQLGVNRHTLRRALSELTRKGLIRSAAASGNVVAPLRIPYRLGEKSLIAEAVKNAGLIPSARLLSQNIARAPRGVAKDLGVADRTPVIELNMLRLANAIPVAYVTAWLPADRFANIGKLFELTGSLRQAMIKSGVPVSVRKSMRIMSRAGLDQECELLGLDRGSPVLTLEVLDVDPAGEPNAVFLNRFSALRSEFIIES